MSDLREKVREALDNALDNGYQGFLTLTSDYRVACDLMEFNSELEDESEVEIIPFVKEWRKEKRL